MPELPEVEVTRRGIAPHLQGQIITAVVFRHSGLRWPFPLALPDLLRGQRIEAVTRRGKYLLLRFRQGVLILHLGMSGHLRVVPRDTAPQKHDHFDLVFGERLLRLRDPRRFGAVLWHGSAQGAIEQHALLKNLGAEPLDPAFSAQLLYEKTRNRSAPIKQVLLAGDIVVGVGNIYASESLFQAGIDPALPAKRIGLARYEKLARAIRATLAAAIEQGGSTLRDFSVNGQSGYFQQSYFVYDRAGQPCRQCGAIVRQLRQAQRSTFYCPNCQK